MGTLDNPNEYDDDEYARASTDLIGAVGAMWSAGASLENIQSDVREGFANEGVEATVSITGKE